MIRTMTLRNLLEDTVSNWKRERPELDFTAMGTALRINLLMNAALKGVGDLFAPHGITVGEFDVLAALRRSGPGAVLTPTALARVAMISPAGMTNRLNQLEAAGLIERRQDPNDRRGSLVELTAEGHETANRAVEELLAAENELFRALSTSERLGLDSSLDKLLDRIDRTSAEGGLPESAVATRHAPGAP